MAVISSEMEARGSGGASQSNPDLWLGGIESSTVLNPVISEENLFNNVGGDEAVAGSTKYRGLYFHNANSTLTLTAVVIWIPTQTPSLDTVAEVALADEGLNVTMETIVNEDTAPVGPIFTSPATKAAGLLMGAVPSNERFGFWLRRVVTPLASAFENDDWAFRIEGTTPA